MDVGSQGRRKTRRLGLALTANGKPRKPGRGRKAPPASRPQAASLPPPGVTERGKRAKRAAPGGSRAVPESGGAERNPEPAAGGAKRGCAQTEPRTSRPGGRRAEAEESARASRGGGLGPATRGAAPSATHGRGNNCGFGRSPSLGAAQVFRRVPPAPRSRKRRSGTKLTRSPGSADKAGSRGGQLRYQQRSRDNSRRANKKARRN